MARVKVGTQYIERVPYKINASGTSLHLTEEMIHKTEYI